MYLVQKALLPLHATIVLVPMFAAAAVSRGVGVDVTDTQGHTPFGFASASNDVHAVRILLEHGADPEKRDIHGHSPVWAARDRGHADVLPLLLSDSLPSSL